MKKTNPDFIKKQNVILDALTKKTFKSNKEMSTYLKKQGETELTGRFLSSTLIQMKKMDLITYDIQSIQTDKNGKKTHSSINYKSIQVNSNKNEIKKIEKQEKTKKKNEEIKPSINENPFFFSFFNQSDFTKMLELKIAEILRMLSYISQVSEGKYTPKEKEFKNISQESLKKLNPKEDYTIERFNLLCDYERTLIRDIEPLITKQDTGPQSYYRS